MEWTGVELQSYVQPFGPILIPEPGSAGSGVFSGEALEFIASLAREFAAAAGTNARIVKPESASVVSMPGFSRSSAELRRSDWCAAQVPSSMQDRSTEIVCAALNGRAMTESMNSGAAVVTADLGDLQFPSWTSIVEGHLNICGAVHNYTGGNADGRDHSALAVKPRRLNQVEKHVLVDGGIVSAGIFDTGIFAYSNASTMLSRGENPHLCIPGIKDRVDASVWNSVFDYMERELFLPLNSIKVTVQIESVRAIYELNEIISELRERAVAVGFGRRGYLASLIRLFGIADGFILPDRSLLAKGKSFTEACERYLVRTAHMRCLPAVGDLSAIVHVPKSGLASVQEEFMFEKERELLIGYDGSRIAHPAFVGPLARLYSSKRLEDLPEASVPEECELETEMFSFPQPKITVGGIRSNIYTLLRIFASWLSGRGCAYADDRIEDISSAELCISLLWQWTRSNSITSDGRVAHVESVNRLVDEELGAVLRTVGGAERRRNYERSALLVKKVIGGHELIPSLVSYTQELFASEIAVS